MKQTMEPRMHTDEHGFEWETVTRSIIGGAFTVGNTLGCGFLEKPYENALAHELRSNGLDVKQQHPIEIAYKGVIVGEYVADLLVEDLIVVELKACRAFDDIHVAQCLNYLKATGKPVCLLINFGLPKVQVRRILNPNHPAGRIHSMERIEVLNH